MSGYPGISGVTPPSTATGTDYPVLEGVESPGTGTEAAATNLGMTVSPTGIAITSDTGTDITLPLADGTNAGLMSPAAHTKVAGIASGATANSTDAQLRDRATHTGQQAISTITGLQSALDGKETVGAASSAVAGHAAAADPHPVYALESSLAAVATSGAYADLSGRPSLAAVATSGAYADLSGRPTLGTASALDAPASGDASSTQAVKGNDSRLAAVAGKAPIGSIVALSGDRTLSDADSNVTFNTSSTSRAITVPNTLAATYGGNVFDGPCTFVAGSGVTIADSRVSGSSYAHCALIPIGTATYRVVGVKA